MTRDELAAFEDDLLAEVGDADSERLATLAREHQAGVRALPGVDDIVYEWRRTLPGEPLLYRSTALYVLVLPGRVWVEFLEGMELAESEASALRELHRRQARRLLAAADSAPEPPPATEALGADGTMVLTRP
jgi:hypothetical protein